MATFEFVVLMTVQANSEEQALERAENTMQNLNDTMGHAPFTVDLELDEDSCEEVEDEEDEEDDLE